MKTTDVISKYLEALRTNLPDDQAQLFAKSWAESMALNPESASKHELELSIEKVNSSVSKLQLVVYSTFLVVIVDILKEWMFG